ncbi:MAG: L,D-transpeptidase family protein [Firmicutes bacterium]|nr:L,D-transpeptidase family protein [Bacillota bacterium]
MKKIFLPLIVAAVIIGTVYTTIRLAGSNMKPQVEAVRNRVGSLFSDNKSENARKGIFDLSESKEISLEASLQKDGRVKAVWKCRLPDNIKVESVELLRSGSRIEAGEMDFSYIPVAKTACLYPKEKSKSTPAANPTGTGNPGGLQGVYSDTSFADNYTYYYALSVTTDKGEMLLSNNVEVKIPAKKLPVVSKPTIHIDKKNYTLTILDGSLPVKKYPVAMGRKPENRKLIRDMASSPEGIYRIIVLQPNATYYRAYDLDYPNKTDEFRYDFAVEKGLVGEEAGSPIPIGGEIQIHGRGIKHNWTAGCIALRNEDMDELFAHTEINAGTKVIITGYELTPEDIKTILYIKPDRISKMQEALKKAGFYKGACDGTIGKSTMRSIGDFQIKNKLPLTCQPDERTLEKLGIPG